MVIQKEIYNGVTVVKMQNDNLTLLVCPEDGMNIYSMHYKEQPIITFDEERWKQGRTFSAPILYPTPNRVEKEEFRWEGKSYLAKTHGLTRNAHFNIAEQLCEEDKIILKGRLHWEKGSEYYAMFPFESILDIQITLQEDKVTYQYTITNNDMIDLPYGFALHPYFVIENQNTEFIVNVDTVMEMTEQNLPTGKMLAVKNTRFDLHEISKVTAHNLDHVYTDISNHPIACIRYENHRLELDASEPFTHMVVFTPNDRYFCLENQTCSTNAHNLYDLGFQKESGLRIIKPGEKESGEITFTFTS